ncbi:MAG: hypothetical protein A2Z88_05980 [Omnitrophica WOR_2 bacterium GWA2_47_8]|nr:MAG: hypothetical protein A2Z88_05980 [Omnitrophica WOR_2 bacterium GWA2_47_8]
MLKYLRKKKGQSTLEYVILIVVIIGALIAIQVYLKRGIQGRMRQAADDIGDQFSAGNYNEDRTTYTKSNTRETFTSGVTNRSLRSQEITNTTVNGRIINGLLGF